jgi:hypothetical protein
VNSIILHYLNTFADLGELKIIERWHGVYPHVQGSLSLVVEHEPGVNLVNGLGGAVMTLSFCPTY